MPELDTYITLEVILAFSTLLVFLWWPLRRRRLAREKVDLGGLRMFRTGTNGLYFWEVSVGTTDEYLLRWGKVGEPAEELRQPFSRKADVISTVKTCRREGYAAIPEEEFYGLSVQYRDKTMTEPELLAKQRDLQVFLDSFLKKRGLGDVVGGQTEDDTMDVLASVVEPEAAVKAVAHALSGHETFHDFDQIILHEPHAQSTARAA